VRERPYRFVCIGGGTGLPVLLRGLREYRQHQRPGWERIDLAALTAIVSFSDDGGSSGRLVREYDTLPPGDLRNCLLALADPEWLPLMTQFFNHRFSASESETLAGHSAGNLLILALSRLHEGDARKAILDLSRLLGIQGKIMFPTLEPAVLCAELSDGAVIVGESSIAVRGNPHPIQRVFLARRGDAAPRPERPATTPAMPEALQAIAEADAIVLGPGSLYSSVISNLLVPEIAAAVRAARGVKVYVANLMIEPGETDGYSVGDHVAAIRRHGDVQVDYVVANRTPIDSRSARRYAVERLEREIEVIKRALDEAAAPAAAPLDTAALAQRVLRMHALLNGVADPSADRGQVLPQNGPCVDGAQLIEIDALTQEGWPEQNAVKRVLRHDPEKVLEAILGLLQRADATESSEERP
jgi:uncharacterized cofD-like protein